MVQKWYAQQIEEYVIQTHELISRRWKKKGKLGIDDFIEIGEPEIKKNENVLPSNSNPTFLQEDQPEYFIFKVRNLIGYDLSMFSVSVDHDKQELIIRTSNKKYFKRFQIGDLFRNGIRLDQSLIAVEFHNGVLVIGYKKPIEIMYKESKRKEELEKLNKKKPQEGDLECSVQ